MSVQLARLRRGEMVAAAGVLVMAVALFAVTWYGPGAGAPAARDGWTGTTHLHWLLVVAMLVGLALVLAQAACRAPAVPVSLSVISTVVAFLAVLWLIFRVVIDAPPHQQAGAWLELAGALGLLGGSFLSMRQEGIRPQDGPGEVPVVELPTPTAP